MKGSYRTWLLLFGPAWLAMIADMDASSYIGAASTGAAFGYGLVWLMALLVIPLFIIQEQAGRIGIATGKGLGTVVRERYGRRAATAVALPMAITDMVTYAIEYLGIGIGLEVAGIPILYTVPLIYVLHIAIVSSGKYRQAEKPLIAMSLLLIAFLVAALVIRGPLPHTDPEANMFLLGDSRNYFLVLAADVGAVVMPFMVFFQASATGTKVMGMRSSNIAVEGRAAIRSIRSETLVGAMVTEGMMIVVVMAFAGIGSASSASFFATPAELSRTLRVLAGDYAPAVFSAGLVAAGFIALIVISLGSAWGVAEALDMKQKNYWLLYVTESLPAVFASILVSASLMIEIVLYLLVFFVLALIAPLSVMWVIGRDPEVMGPLTMPRRVQAAYLASSALVVSTAFIAMATSI
ncbi:hypothetical protein GCM10007108_16190 [Thermogymnomonas acidicola]|uniref:Uncharacterized protein n=1 Tax=Thermogymnomonas acidicola TaxID=399579 RepID=A0AA37F9Z7_9ARCH|nr:divalent metal cation transporter [Thermogymnomonas acidicola]GGM78757.1 hypothetical protein GCM10007108_16190 [Thermogymnomonas acidicola]